WVAPTTRENGSPIALSDIDGYEIHFGTESGTYTQMLSTTDNTTTISDLDEGTTWYFAVKAYDVDGNYSQFSDEVFTTLK
ncbi:MAG: fibronectin type III domain-containing protein, partial [Aquisalimonadaceae bacterium]